jgi:hypothetical protein
VSNLLFGVSDATAIVALASTTPSRPLAFAWSSGFFSVALDSSRVYYTGISSPTLTACTGHCRASLPLDDFDRLVAIKAITAPSKDPFSPSAFTAPEPTVSKAATPWLPSARPGFHTLTAPSRLPVRPGPIPSRTAHGVHPSGLSPFAEPWHLSVLFALLAFGCRRSRPTGRRPTRPREVKSTGHLRREAQVVKRPGAPTRVNRTALAPLDSPGQSLARLLPPGLGILVP